MMQKKVAVLGLGITGKSAVSYLLKRGFEVIGIDQNEKIGEQPAIQTLKKRGLQLADSQIASLPNICELNFCELNFCELDFLVVSPGISPLHPIYRAAKQAGIEILGEIELACRTLKHPCVAITGSNGKTTTTLLIQHILKQAGIFALAVGNIGVPLTQVVDDYDEKPIKPLLILELSSWQLETMEAKCLDAAMILNITPNHLDRHGTLENYAKAKLNIIHCLKEKAPLFINDSCLPLVSFLMKPYDYFTFGTHRNCHLATDYQNIYEEKTVAFQIPSFYQTASKHDLENLLAAYSLCKHLKISIDLFIEGLKTFIKPPHRIEFVSNHLGVAYYNDSKATSTDAVIKAVESLSGRIILIVGGVHKGSSYHCWITAFLPKVSLICAIGQAAAYIDRELGPFLTIKIFATLESAFAHAVNCAKTGETVLLSPGCASYDMFKDYEERGDKFKSLVHRLPLKEGKRE